MSVEYNRNGDFVLIVIKDASDNKIFSRRINLSNKQEYFDTMISIAEKYGFKPEVDFGNDANSRINVDEEKKKELDWFGFSR